jgi:hypothetical protein
MRLRDGDDAWVHVTELAAPDAWGEIDAHVRGRAALEATTKGIATVRFDRDEKLVAPGPLSVTLDGTAFSVAADEDLAFHREAGHWTRGASKHAAPWKSGEITGPLRDAFHAPLLFVYGADDPAQTRATAEVAKAWAQIRYGVTVRYPVMSDAEFFDHGEALANDRALFLVGNAKSNRVVRALEGDLPITVDASGIALGGRKIEPRDGGRQLGAAFVWPNPKRTDRYVVVVEGVDALGTWRSLSLPDLLPDFVVYDEGIAPSRGQMLLGAGSVRAAGFFQNDWSLPTKIDDPLAAARRPGAKSEYDATPYLP